MLKGKVAGFRAPMCSINSTILDCLETSGYTYDSSIHPTYVPGRYNNIGFLVHPYHPSKERIDKIGTRSIVEIPISVTPILHLPIGWMWIRNIGAWYTIIAAERILRRTLPVVLYFHPWDVITPPKVEGVPWYIYRGCDKMLSKLERFIEHFKHKGLPFHSLIEICAGIQNARAAHRNM